MCWFLTFLNTWLGSVFVKERDLLLVDRVSCVGPFPREEGGGHGEYLLDLKLPFFF